ncbi:hypothetical protein [Mycolicibacterium arenosum]|uniref:Uncharacterized protein n=1 Tax=Mycolicibacterium arenosum TaxID=2952157 RepID=A0ABT1M2Y7_9MYCO|nr:hypothetical protein [Mycolicibacterium sp. CAU 1645]MCP9272624.1 hypothetical protein [Mycolicibacterium sp. CAU 1645]
MTVHTLRAVALRALAVGDLGEGHARRDDRRVVMPARTIGHCAAAGCDDARLDYNVESSELRDDPRSPWPTSTLVLLTSPAHVGATLDVTRLRCNGSDENGHVGAMEIAEVRTERDADGHRPCETALLAIGFEGGERMALSGGLGLGRRGGPQCRARRRRPPRGSRICRPPSRAAPSRWAVV